MPTSQVLAVLIANPFFSFLILAASQLPGPWRKPPASWNLEKLRFYGSFTAPVSNIIILKASVKSPG